MCARFRQFKVLGDNSNLSIGVWYTSGDTDSGGRSAPASAARSKFVNKKKWFTR